VPTFQMQSACVPAAFAARTNASATSSAYT
jgi:hypothetical protein